MDLQCEIKDNSSLRCIKSTRILQRCELQTINGKRADHVNNLKVLECEGSLIHYQSGGLYKFFPQLKHLNISGCGLKEITSKNLFALKNLERLDVNHNDLESLPDDLLIHTTKLKRIDFGHNKLEFVSSRLFDPIPENQLTFVTFRGNKKLDAAFARGGRWGALKTLGELKSAIDSSCSDPITPLTCNCLAKSTSTNYKKLWDLKEFSDFTIVVGSKEIPVHKVVLAAQSSVFASILKSNQEVKATNQFKIKDHGEKYDEVVTEFLHSLYTGKVENKENALLLLSLVKNFHVDQVEDACENAAIAQLTYDNAMVALKLGNHYKSEKVIDAAFGMVKEMLPDELDEELKRKPEKVEEILKNYTTYKQSLKRAKLN